MMTRLSRLGVPVVTDETKALNPLMLISRAISVECF